MKKWFLTLILLLAVTDLDGTLTTGDTICAPIYGCEAPYAEAVETLTKFNEVLYLSCKPWIWLPFQNLWLWWHDFPPGESHAIGGFPGGCTEYDPVLGSVEKCLFLLKRGIRYDYGYSEDTESLLAYECANIPNPVRVPPWG